MTAGPRRTPIPDAAEPKGLIVLRIACCSGTLAAVARELDPSQRDAMFSVPALERDGAPNPATLRARELGRELSPVAGREEDGNFELADVATCCC